jgi:hypothetical protein
MNIVGNAVISMDDRVRNDLLQGCRADRAGPLYPSARDRRDVRIPTKPAMHSNVKPATCSDLKPAGVPI